MNKIVLNIGGMSCSACSQGLEKYLKKQTGVVNANVNLVLSQALIEYDDTLDINDLNRFVQEAGFESLGVYNDDIKEIKDDNKIKLFIFGILAVFVLYISMSHMIGLPVIPYLHMVEYPCNYALVLFILCIPFLFYGIDIFKSGLKNLLHKTPNMDTLVSIGVTASFLYSFYGLIMILMGNKVYVENLYFESVAVIIFFIKFGRFIDVKNKDKTKAAIKELVQITPSVSILKTKNGEKEVTIDEVKKDDILIAKPGMKIAVDGIIVKGDAHLDEAFITGESIPAKRGIDEKVIAGSINYDGYIEYKALKIGRESTISEIVKLVIEATNTKPPIAKLADKVSGYFVPAIMIISVLTFLMYLIVGFSFNDAISTFVTVLVVACPCALGLATPLAIVVSEGICAKNGILVKTSETLENAHKVDTVVFDKTGTLTYGILKISKIYNYGYCDDSELIRLVASIEAKSIHPISKAFICYADERKLQLSEIEHFKNISGVGLEGTIDGKKIYVGNSKIFSKLKLENNYLSDELYLSQNGNSIVYVVFENNVIGLIGVKDIVRENAKKTVSILKKMDKEVIMLTGDNEIAASTIALDIGIKNVIANVLPASKTEIIRDLKKKMEKE